MPSPGQAESSSGLSSASVRIHSLDQFRGYTVLGMFFVNFIGSALAIPAVFKHHHTYCSYADTIMPQFLFAVGFAYRLTLLRRLSQGKVWSAYGKVLWRSLGLILIAFVIYPLGEGITAWSQWSTDASHSVLVREFKRSLFQTLTHIAVTSIWVMPVIAARPGVRLAFAAASGMAHLLLSYAFNYTWVNSNPVGIDGGPLGFLAWTIPLLAGSLAYDAWMRGAPTALQRCAAWGLALMVLGYAMSCLWVPPRGSAGAIGIRAGALPFVNNAQRPPDGNVLTMSLRSASVSYMVFTAGVSLLVYAGFIAMSDLGRLRLGVLGTLGGNALAGYILHDLVGTAVQPFLPRDAPLWYVLAATGAYLGICYVFLRYMEKREMFLRL